jgi:hypothetical protein
LRQDLQYPHLPTMLAVDPTEAIHSELIMETFRRYFTVEDHAPLGGAIAYPLLTHNQRFLDAMQKADQSKWVEWILEADDRFLADHPEASLFAYFAGRPNKAVLQQTEQLSRWEGEEAEREHRARASGGEYYPRGALVTAVIDLEIAQRESDAALARVDALQSEIATVKSSVLYRCIHRVFDARLVRLARRNRSVRKVGGKARGALARSRT